MEEMEGGGRNDVRDGEREVRERGRRDTLDEE